MANLSKESVHAVVTDPPYGIGRDEAKAVNIGKDTSIKDGIIKDRGKVILMFLREYVKTKLFLEATILQTVCLFQWGGYFGTKGKI